MPPQTKSSQEHRRVGRSLDRLSPAPNARGHAQFFAARRPRVENLAHIVIGLLPRLLGGRLRLVATESSAGASRPSDRAIAWIPASQAQKTRRPKLLVGRAAPIVVRERSVGPEMRRPVRRSRPDEFWRRPTSGYRIGHLMRPSRASTGFSLTGPLSLPAAVGRLLQAVFWQPHFVVRRTPEL